MGDPPPPPVNDPLKTKKVWKMIPHFSTSVMYDQERRAQPASPLPPYCQTQRQVYLNIFLMLIVTTA